LANNDAILTLMELILNIYVNLEYKEPYLCV